MSLALPDIVEVLARNGLVLVNHVKVAQVFAVTAAELIDKVRTRSLSNLAALDGDLFNEGCLALERDANAGAVSFPLVEHLDLVVFRSC